jgi:hypothetical protein
MRAAPVFQLVMRPWSSVLMMAVSAALSTIWRHCEAEMGDVFNRDFPIHPAGNLVVGHKVEDPRQPNDLRTRRRLNSTIRRKPATTMFFWDGGTTPPVSNPSSDDFV